LRVGPSWDGNCGTSTDLVLAQSAETLDEFGVATIFIQAEWRGRLHGVVSRIALALRFSQSKKEGKGPSPQTFAL